MGNSYEDRILFDSIINNDEEINDIVDEYSSKGDLLVACKSILSDNLPAMDIRLVFMSTENGIKCFADMTSSTVDELSSDYHEEYSIENIDTEKFVESFMNLDEKTLEDIAIKISARICEDLIQFNSSRVIKFADYTKNNTKEEVQR